MTTTQTKMGRKVKPQENKVIQAPVWFTPKDISLIEKKYGSLTNALKETALIEAKKDQNGSGVDK